MKSLAILAVLFVGAGGAATGALETSIKERVNAAPAGPITKSVRCTNVAVGETRCVLRSFRGTELKVRVTDGRVAFEPIEG